jgi:hypothetical protein
MDLSQKKLTSEEWDALERPVSKDEENILRMIQQGYDNVNISFNDTQSLMNFIKVSENFEMHHQYFFEKYFKKKVMNLKKKYNIDSFIEQKKKKNKPLKKRELIRIANVDKKIDSMNDKIIEFVLLTMLSKYLKIMNSKKKSDDKRSKSYLLYYTISQIMKYSIKNINPEIIGLLEIILLKFKDKMNKKNFVKYAYKFIEENKELHKFKDIKLYEHQKQVFTLSKSNEPKMILYQAPTGTGKTITPIGLVSMHDTKPKRRIIFVCAAKHIGLQLAKSCISMNIKIAVAFGCSDPGGIRLHYFAAKDYVKNRRTGGIFRVDNSVGDNVQIMISDIRSYIPAMRYMLAFNKPEELIWYWDEPTITLDYKEHEYHNILKENWQQNEIPNIILSSATLPLEEDIHPCIQSYISKFSSTNITTIKSNDCTKTIPILDSNGFIVLPHFVYDTFDKLKMSLKHIKKYQTILRHFDLNEISSFIIYVNKHIEIRDRYKVENYFEEISEIDSISIKQYYVKLLGCLRDNYHKVYQYFQEKRRPLFDSCIKITTEDAYSLTDGPTIYMVDDVKKIANYCLKTSKIPANILAYMLEIIEKNEKIRIEISELEKNLTKNQHDTSGDSRKGEGDSRVNKSKKNSREVSDDTYIKDKEIMQRIDGLKSLLIKLELDNEFVPNTHEHLEKYDNLELGEMAFSSDIEESIVEKIMLLDIDSIWKVLLMMGIGVFTNEYTTNVYKGKDRMYRDYIAIMKELAQKQQLYLIIASTDYIYGTNYQFCHGYIGKDLINLTQEKAIQAIGRVGRKNTKCKYSIRLRNNNIIDLLFMKSENMIEVNNMNRLFG